MLNPRARAVLTAYVVVGVVQVTAQATGPGWLAGLTQVLLMPVLVAVLLVQTPTPRSRLVTLTLGALAASWLGDTAPRLLDGDPAFLAMVGCFLVAQLCYITAFRPYAGDSILRRSRGWLAAYAVVVVALIVVCLPGAGVLAPAVVVYGLCLGTMAVLATGVDRLAWVGGAFFLASDGLIAIDAFSDLDLPAHDLPLDDVSVMATYVVAQLLLLLGVIRRDASVDLPGVPEGEGAAHPRIVPSMSNLLVAARAWAADDPDDQTRAELEGVIAAVEAGGDASDLADRFDGTLEFGTAGLRGELGAGPNRMNRVVVTRAAAGLASYLLDTGHRGGAVVIGYDARHNSDVFARDTAEVMTGAGLTAYVLPRPLPTPILAFAIRELGCAAGVMVTASHNPPRDNGYKVYLGDGSQIVPPADAAIAARIAAVGPVADVPRGRPGKVLQEEIVDSYLDTVAGLVDDGPRDLEIVYTPLHGVGGVPVERVLEAAGFDAPSVVEQQEQPDPDFPTVAFPNPEEPGAMDLAIELAARNGADLVVANDPDADRCAAAVPDPHGWRLLRGDEVGALLAHAVLASGKQGTYACSIVSSSLLGKLAAAAGQPYAETLTGFKWISKVDDLAFGYEEALGYCVDPHNVKDKDGVSALLLLCALAAEAKAEGRTLVDILDDIALAHGLHATDQLSVRVTDLGEIAAAMARLRATPPTELGGLAVEAVDDLSLGSAELPPTDGLRYRLAGGARVIVRPSGTEPKLKCYLEVVVPVDPEDGVDAARISAVGRLDALRDGIKSAAGI